MLEDAAVWLTSVRLRRLTTVVRSLPRSEDAWSPSEATRTLYRSCGGSIDEIDVLLKILRALSLAKLEDDQVCLTRPGDGVARSARKGDLKPLGLALIRHGVFARQAEQLIEVGSVGKSGDLECPRRMVRSLAPQLLGILAWWDIGHEGSTIVIPKKLLEELCAVWALLPPPTVPTWAIARKQVGDRAEMYTVQFERSRTTDPSMIHWIAQETDSLGWDVEDHAVSPRRNIEVKGSRGRNVVFNLSQNEWEKAKELADQYELQFWGGIDLTRDPMTEYSSLRSEGYPLCYPSFAKRLTEPGWRATPKDWRVVYDESELPT